MSGQRLLRLGLAALFAALFVMIGYTGWAYSQLSQPYAGWEGKAADVLIEPGLDAGGLLERLAQAGVVRQPAIVRAWLSLRGGADRLHAGEYRFERPLSAFEVLDRLQRGDVRLYAVTFPEGLVLGQIARRLEDAGFGPAPGLIEAFGDPTPILDLDPEATDLEGYLFPDTYHFPRGAAPERIVATMVARFREVLGEGFDERAAAVGMDLRGAVVLASMIERETSMPDERARISAVFHNRLERGMKMECDPTVRYALERAGQPVERLTYDDLRFESPWNTYVVTGLPVGPIANPGQASLEASVEPITSKELYFVAQADGGHAFSETLAQHLRAVAEWRRYTKSSR